MTEEYILIRDIIYDHNARMLNIKKYYPYFRLADIDFSGYQDGKYIGLDMGYILMAVLRFFIEENNFREKDVTYDEYERFMKEIYQRDFDMRLSKEEEKNISQYIFDKIRNDGKPFIYEYFDPSEKKKKIIRMRIIDSRIKDDTITYYITSDAIEFYLDTKEIKDESSISVAQILLSKMIESRNFKGGTEVIRRINNEVAKLKMRKNEVLTILTQDVFEGTKAYEEFVNTGVRWFEEEQKLFRKNMEMINEALKRTNDEGEHIASIKDIYELETELKKAILKHSELLSACTELQIMADEMIESAKYRKLRRSFDFGEALKLLMKEDRADLLKVLTEPLMKVNTKKRFDLKLVDRLLSLPAEREDIAEKVSEDETEKIYVYEDEAEEERIEHNYTFIIKKLLETIVRYEKFDLRFFCEKLKDDGKKMTLHNIDLYGLFVHMSQKKEYDIKKIMESPDTFFEKHLIKAVKEMGSDYENIKFNLEFDSEDEIEITDVARISNITFKDTNNTATERN